MIEINLMELSIHLFIHLLLSLFSGFIVWKIWKLPLPSFVSALIGGVFIDIDHLLDYVFAFGLIFNLESFLWGSQFLESDKLYVLLHAWEYVIILLILTLILRSKTAKSVALALVLGIFFHLGTDVLINGLPAKSYSIIYRIKSGFDLKYLVTEKHYQKHLEQKSLLEYENFDNYYNQK